MSEWSNEVLSKSIVPKEPWVRIPSCPPLFIDDTLVNIEQAKKRNILIYRFLNVNDIDDIKKLVFNNNDIDCNK